MDADARRTEEI
jgi:hypothetical protein